VDVEQLSQYKAPNPPAGGPTPDPITPPPTGGPSHRWGLLGAFFVLALLLSAVAYFFLSEKYAAEPVIPSYTPRDTAADWKTYANPSVGFSFQYPSDFTITNQTDEQDPDNTQKRSVSFEINNQSLFFGIVVNWGGRGGISIANPITKTVSANGTDITYSTGKQQEFGGTEELMDRVWVSMFTNDGNRYEIIFRSPDGSDRTTLVDQILSTFKFTQ